MNASPESLHTPADAAPRNVHSRGNRFGNWREHHGWSAASSLRRLASRPFGSLLTIAVMGLALALPLAFYLLLGNVQKLGDALGQSQAISVFLQPGQAAPQAQLLATQLTDRAELAAVVVKTPQQGMDELARMQGFSGALQTLDDNPLPYVLQLQPRAGASAQALEQLVADVRGMRGVDMVQDSGSWRKRLDALLGVGNRVVLVLASLLALAALLVVGNTVRVDIASRSEEIGVLLLVGASGAFVRRPYLYAGIWYGLFSGILAALLAVLIEFALAAPVAQLSQAYDGKLQVGGLPLWLLLAVPLAAAALGWLGARLVSAWQLRKAA
ncbi:cell division protein [Rhodanobacter sp. FW510-R12]|uniref:permease-like cell division protein FtsX n=1 Tax=unclassified Rhodanobacter TaxID=2621553 RepID=UPI0007AA4D75|nr:MULTISPECIES: permease-like cell division protein FtsX [unclassified Rhodanobacter]KZC17424.1 cell division protein [Rhodanobacter sp. FW104-R8]KZC27886.1 cell division protein [Rhodanobacter sp. FW510-T8]KZC32073.1 cell division protein [Rhodanobacter sp. FW510-R10]